MRFQGYVYRCHAPKWAHDPLSGNGASINGGRFNPPGISAFYTSLDPVTAVAEVAQGGIFSPKTVVAYYVDYEGVVDLTTDVGRSAVGVLEADMRCYWELLSAHGQTPPSWTVAERLLKLGSPGVLVPSYAANAPDGAKNLVLWKVSADLPHFISVHDPNRELPKNQKSWK